MTDEPVLLGNDRNGVRTLTLNRPRRKNAINLDLWIALHDALARRRKTARCAHCDHRGWRSVLLGCRHLNSRGQPSRLQDASADRRGAVAARTAGTNDCQGDRSRRRRWMEPCAGLRPGGRNPESTFSQIFSKRGQSLDLGGSWLLPKLVGAQQAKRLTLLAETIDAEEAQALNLVTWVVSAADIGSFVTDLAERLVAGPAVALAQSKARRTKAPTGRSATRWPTKLAHRP